ncbi:MAG: stage V sporulation protein AD [Firmicutes bacterium]|nr:stage V sporulation protein AD [Bacillota bacterium]
MTIVKACRQTWLFPRPPRIISAAAVAGPREGRGPLGPLLDHVFPALRWGRCSFEQCEQQMQRKAVELALSKAGLAAADIDLLAAGDLLNQITPSGFTARALDIPFWGLFSACATMGEALAVTALAVASGAAERALAAAGSHTCTAERQFRYPNEYGAQKPPSAQHTVTAYGAALLGSSGGKTGIAAVTLGRVRDEGVRDPFQVGAAMAPAFAHTVAVHLAERGVRPEHYDLILSGDLGRDGLALGRELLRQAGVDIAESRLADCGLLLRGGADARCAGASGCGCAAAVACSWLLRRLDRGELRRVLLCPTGALFSPTASQQGETIPGICHAVALEYCPEVEA